jgi:hypothetical protein
MTDQYPQPHPQQTPPTEIWGSVTDPTQHDPENFRYLVHAINPLAVHTMPLADMQFGQHIISSAATGDQRISMYNEPERVGERVSLSMSLIDSGHTATWGNAGLIIEAPKANIAITSPIDAGILNADHELLSAMANAGNIMDGDELLERTSVYEHNEIVAVCARGAGQVALKGFFYKTTTNGQALDLQLANRMKVHGMLLDLPVVPIAQKSPYAENGFERVNGNFAIRFGGEHYLINGTHSDQYNFFATDEFGNSYFASPNQITSALDYAVEAGEITREEAAAHQERYHEANKQRSLPHVTFAEDGTIRQITQVTGYGAAEARVIISRTGKGTVVNARQEQAEINQRMLGGPRSSEYEDKALPPYRVARVIEAACETLDEEAAQKVRIWYDSVAAERQQEWVASQRRYTFESQYPQLGDFKIIEKAIEGATILDLLRGKNFS